jgi:hypothetical protein
MVSADNVPLKVKLIGHFVIGKEVPGSYEGASLLHGIGEEAAFNRALWS